MIIYKKKDLVPPIKEMPDNPIAKMNKLPSFLVNWIVKLNYKKMRAGMGGNSKDISKQPIKVSNQKIKGFKDLINVRIYSPKTDDIKPVHVFFHGGGFFGGSLDAVDDYCKAVSDQGNCVVVSVDYHLAPEHKYPEGIEDAYAAILWIINHKKSLKVNINKLSVSGDSAGGNIAAVMTLMAKDRKAFKIDKQVLIYPTINAAKALTTKDPLNKAMLKLYLKKIKDAKHPYVSPYLYSDQSDLPDTLIAVGEYDFLKEESYLYAKKLDEHNVSVTHILYANAFHAFIDNTGNDLNANDLASEVANFINQ